MDEGDIMTDRQKRFVIEYLICLNATQAAIKAGYSPKTANEQGSRLLANVSIQEAIDKQLEQLQNEKTADAQEILEHLSAVMRGECTEQVLSLNGNGMQKITNIAVSAKDRIKAAELLGRCYGLFKGDMKINSQVVFIDDLCSEE